MSEFPVVAEGTTAVWFYHLRGEQDTDGFCGRPTFDKNLPLRLWGYVGHLNERYCKPCQAAARSAGITLPRQV